MRDHHDATGTPHRTARGSRAYWRLLAVLLLAVVGSGCTSTEWLRRTDSLAPWMHTSPEEWISKPLKPTPRTRALLGRLHLDHHLAGDPQELLSGMQKFLEQGQTPELLYAYAEIAFLAGQKLEPVDPEKAFDIYAASVAHAYLYLFDPRFNELRNPYDPHFRGASDLYNKSLDRALRLIVAQGGLKPGTVHTCTALDHELKVHVVGRRTSWQGHEIERYEFVSDFETVGLDNHYRTYGLGVPMIAVRKRSQPTPPMAPSEVPNVEKFYPDTLSLPVTAFLRLDPVAIRGDGKRPQMRAVLELVDPLVSSHIHVAGRRVPLESDLSTPIAYDLDSMKFDALTVATYGMIQPDTNKDYHGLFMMEPYQPGKIPVVFVHGLWSSPVTWVEMFNDLRGDPEIRARYQFWYYFYPTGQPFLYTGATLRRDLAELRATVDPQHRQPALDQMVLVGHSMGGLVSKLQAVDSGDEFWNMVANEPFDELDVDEATREQLAEVFFFRANPSVRRVVTIATPHHGSQMANSLTRWLARAFFTLPKPLTDLNAKLQNRNPGVFRFEDPFNMPTSIDTLKPDSPLLAALLSRPRPSWITYNNVIGKAAEESWFFEGEGDGVVPFDSAKAPLAATEVVVPATHQTIHRHPLTVLEMRRLLGVHLAMVDRERGTRLAEANRRMPGARMHGAGRGAPPQGKHWQQPHRRHHSPLFTPP